MAIYFLLGKLTSEGQRMICEDHNHLAGKAANVSTEGAEMLGQYAVLGGYDYIVMVQADENEPVARFSAEFGKVAGMRFETLSGISASFLAETTGDQPEELEDAAYAQASGQENRRQERETAP